MSRGAAETAIGNLGGSRPQSLLGQLLQIYQESGSDRDSPLAKFVGKLLGLDRLDALEAGLQPLADVRNVRKITKGWSAAETERTRIERLLDGQIKTRKATAERIDADLKRLAALCTGLELTVEVNEAGLIPSCGGFDSRGGFPRR